MHADKVDSPVLNADFHQSSDIGGAEEVEFSPNECFAVEVFCGSAGLTAEMRNIFPTSYDIDHKVAKPLSKVIVLDLENTHNQQLLLVWTSRRDLPLGSFWCPLRNVKQGKGNTPFTTSSRPKASEVVAASRWFASSFLLID